MGREICSSEYLCSYTPDYEGRVFPSAATHCTKCVCSKCIKYAKEFFLVLGHARILDDVMGVVTNYRQASAVNTANSAVNEAKLLI